MQAESEALKWSIYVHHLG